MKLCTIIIITEYVKYNGFYFMVTIFSWLKSFKIMSAAYSPAATSTEFGVPETGAGKTLASATRSPRTPRTLHMKMG